MPNADTNARNTNHMLRLSCPAGEGPCHWILAGPPEPGGLRKAAPIPCGPWGCAVQARDVSALVSTPHLCSLALVRPPRGPADIYDSGLLRRDLGRQGPQRHGLHRQERRVRGFLSSSARSRLMCSRTPPPQPGVCMALIGTVSRGWVLWAALGKKRGLPTNAAAKQCMDHSTRPATCSRPITGPMRPHAILHTSTG